MVRDGKWRITYRAWCVVLTGGNRLVGVRFSERSQPEQRPAIVVGGTHAVAGRNQIRNVLLLENARGGLFAFYCGSGEGKRKVEARRKKKRKIRYFRKGGLPNNVVIVGGCTRKKVCS